MNAKNGRDIGGWVHEHTDLWQELWESWKLFGDSVSIQWVPSHVGITGNEKSDRGAAKGAERSLQQWREHRSVRNIWNDLGLQEMDDAVVVSEYNSDSLAQSHIC